MKIAADLTEVRTGPVRSDQAEVRSDRGGSGSLLGPGPAAVLALQRTAGNRAVAAAVAAGRASAPLQRKVGLDAGILGGPSLGARVKKAVTGQDSTFTKLSRAADDYQKAPTALEEVALLGTMLGLATFWEQRFRTERTRRLLPSERERLPKVQAFQTMARGELPKAREQLRYIADIHRSGAASSNPAMAAGAQTAEPGVKMGAGAGGFGHLSGDATFKVPENMAKLTAGKGFTGGGMPGTRKDAGDLIAKYKLTDAEVAAVEVYTAEDYKYINHALSGWDEGIARDLPGVGGRRGTDSDVTGAKAEGLQHGNVAMAAMRKLPPFVGEVYRGMRMPKKRFDEQFPEGATPDFKYLMSASTKRSVAEKFAQPKPGDKGDAGSVSVLLFMNSKTGRDVSPLSLVKEEGEVLFMPPTTWGVYHSYLRRMSVAKDPNALTTFYEVGMTEKA